LLNAVILEFEQSIKEKDSVRFQKLFFDKDVSFVGIMSHETEMSIKKGFPEFEGISVSNCTKFISEICQSKEEQTENFYDIVIQTDGSIATISFDYSFMSGERMIQWGHEKWNLVKTEDQWLITDVVFSIRFPDVEKFPYGDN